MDENIKVVLNKDGGLTTASDSIFYVGDVSLVEHGGTFYVTDGDGQFTYLRFEPSDDESKTRMYFDVVDVFDGVEMFGESFASYIGNETLTLEKARNMSLDEQVRLADDLLSYYNPSHYHLIDKSNVGLQLKSFAGYTIELEQ